MKKILAMLLVLAMALSLVACGGGQLTEELCENVRNISKRFGRANWDALKAVEKATAVNCDNCQIEHK